MNIPWKSEWPPKPNLSWLSYNTFDECQRRWFYHYALDAYNGADIWDYRQHKQLMPWGTLAGRVVDDVITAAFRRLRRTGRMPKGISKFATGRVREYLTFSREWTVAVTSKASWPTNSYLQPLDKVFFGEGPTDEEVSTVIAKAVTALETFETSEFVNELVLNPPDQWVFTRDNPADIWPWFMDGDIPVWASFDLIFRRGTVWYVVDWKTGDAEKGLERALEQLHWYGTYVWKEWGVEAANIRLVVGNISVPNAITEHEFDVVRAEGIRRSWSSRYQALLAKLQSAPPIIDQFPATQHDHICRSCPFRSCPERRGGAGV